MTVRTEPYKGAESYLLENAYLCVRVLPALGGKISSIYAKAQDFELLFQNPKPEYRPARAGDSFEAFDASGFDDAFPNVNPETLCLNGRTIPFWDHGEIWFSQMRASWANGGLTLGCEGTALPYLYEKRLSLSENWLTAAYTITNGGDFAFPCLWTMHALARYEPDMRIVLPKGARQARSVVDSPVLGAEGTLYDLASTTNSADFTRVPPAGEEVFLKYYLTSPVEQGVAGYDYPSQGVSCRYVYDAAALPYLGFWLTAGGFRGDRNCALEPSSGYYDSVSTARENRALPMLAPGEKMLFTIKIGLMPLSNLRPLMKH